MIVNGTQTQSIQIDVSCDEMIKALAHRVGVPESALYDKYDIIWEEKKDSNDKTVLVEKRNISYHGSACYEETGRFINGTLLELYKALKLIKDDCEETKKKY